MARKIIWIFAWPIYRLFVAIFFKFEVKGTDNLKNLKKPFIIAANHASYLDGELIVVALPWFSAYFPIRYGAAEYYYNQLVLGTILWILGGFPIKQGIGIEQSLKQAVNLLKNNEVVGIFPEGKISRNGDLGKGKPGISYLALKTGCQILPVGIAGSYNLSVKSVIFERRKITVNFGKPFFIQEYIGQRNPDPEKDREILIKGAQIVMDKIKKLL